MNRTQRSLYNKSNIVNTCGHIGRVQTLQNIPVLPGDSLEFDFDCVLRLSPPRLDMITEAQVDICGFYTRMRHYYGQQYLDWVHQGPDAAPIINDTIAIPVIGDGDAEFNRTPAYLHINECGSTLPKHIINGYNHIFQRYYAVKNTPNNGHDLQDFFTNLDFYPEADKHHLLFGKLAARLPHIMNGGTILEGPGAVADIDLDDTDATVTGASDPIAETSSFDVRDLREIRARYKAEVDTAWFNNSYSDLFQSKFGTHITADADQQPEYLFRHTMNLSGMDIDGTDDATHGSYVSKSVGRIQFRMPRKVFAEHGNVWILALIRFPLIHTDEIHPLYTRRLGDNIQGNLAYVNDFNVVAGAQPHNFNPENLWLTGPSTWVPSVTTKEPPFQHYRYHQNYTHPWFKRTPGFPFTDWRNTTGDLQWYYYDDNEYNATFKNTQFAQWRLHGRNKVSCFSLLAPPTTNIYAGA